MSVCFQLHFRTGIYHISHNAIYISILYITSITINLVLLVCVRNNLCVCLHESYTAFISLPAAYCYRMSSSSELKYMYPLFAHTHTYTHTHTHTHIHTHTEGPSRPYIDMRECPREGSSFGSFIVLYQCLNYFSKIYLSDSCYLNSYLVY